ncbi:MAG: polysaccharide deacetylase family protein [Saprospiraceae bacterium]|nr:polysaccharide deacetylase family protein [Saprospiraceae bacterium]
MKSSDIIIVADGISPRLEYVLNFIFSETLELKYDLILLENLFESDNRLTIYYGQKASGKFNIQIPAVDLLYENDIRVFDLKTEIQNSLPVLFPVSGNEKFDFNHDLFALVFYSLTRYEEYLPFEGDCLGRFPATKSIAYHAGFLNIPLVDHWIQKLSDLLPKHLTGSNYQKKYRLLPTIDIDQAWAFSFKGVRNAGGFLKDILNRDTGNFKKRLNAIRNPDKDPFNTYGILNELHRFYGYRPHFFFLMAEKTSEYDKNHAPQNPNFRKLIQSINQNYTVGIHPSIQSSNSLLLLKKEIESLGRIIGSDLHDSRQHFIKLHFPDTYRNLIECGIKQDFSMGYPDHIGYRASTGYSFYWFDLKANAATNLQITPFQIMDVTLKNYMKLTSEEAKSDIGILIENARSVNSPITAIWHNSSLDEEGDWSGWVEVYVYLLSQGL